MPTRVLHSRGARVGVFHNNFIMIRDGRYAC